MTMSFAADSLAASRMASAADVLSMLRRISCSSPAAVSWASSASMSSAVA
jgi:hypothetical protein